MRPASPNRALAATPATVADLIERHFLECMAKLPRTEDDSRLKPRPNLSVSAEGSLTLTWINDRSSERQVMGRMAYYPRKFSILEVAGIITILVSAVLLAGIAYSIWQ